MEQVPYDSKAPLPLASWLTVGFLVLLCVAIVSWVLGAPVVKSEWELAQNRFEKAFIAYQTADDQTRGGLEADLFQALGQLDAQDQVEFDRFQKEINDLQSQIDELTADQQNSSKLVELRRKLVGFRHSQASCKPGADRVKADTELKSQVNLVEWLQFVKEWSQNHQPSESRVMTVNGSKVHFRWCPADSYLMGENQAHVTLSRGFWCMETEVTQSLWNAVMEPNPVFSQDPKSKAIGNVTYFEAIRFCEQLSQQIPKTPPDLQALADRLPSVMKGAKQWRFALPTEAQWEYACRARSIDETQIDDYEIIGHCGHTKLLATYSMKPNHWGIRNMRSSVWEWTEDWYSIDLVGGQDPVGFPSSELKVFRGGTGHQTEPPPATYRNGFSPVGRHKDLGFRAVLVYGGS